ncbi:alpha/beta hydrolase [Robertkochia marina]|uniref:Alpha/beta hydrolase n=1 Tax=Robertkochia marina TaxID=1227945 RepID=A0A4S3M1F0_9FLAO|nr:alpha/beta hydrolase [Robertkochia marina]THD68856.1 alpha/beta hydrolase [Robertkochia marina]TRZ43931.1 alpha/beta hydrolase [Robertkochia marina]
MLNYYIYNDPKHTEWVTFVHGAGGSSSIWFKQIRSFKEHYNVLVLDLRGHGRSKPKFSDALKSTYTFQAITKDIIEVLDHLKIDRSHFVGISLGTILIRNLAEIHPERVQSMIMGGAILKLNFRSQILMRFGVIFKSVIPYMYLYKLFAFIIMPRKTHKESRLLFVNEAKKLYQKEFIRWFKMASEINPLLRFFRLNDIGIPTIYIMGDQDHLFLPNVQKVVQQHRLATLLVVPDCGHVVNVQKSQVFNQESLSFLKGLRS